MELKELLADRIPQLKEMKEETVRDNPEDPDMLTMITAFRNDTPIAMMGCPPNRNVQLLLLHKSIVGLGADAVVFSMETCHSTHTVNPGTGEVWKPGELQEVLEAKPDWLVPGMIQEAVVIMAWNRAGEMAADHLLFEVDGDKVVWLDNDGWAEATNLGGYLHEEISLMWQDETLMTQALRELQEGSMPENVRQDMLSIGEVERLAHLDMAVATSIKIHPFPCPVFFAFYEDPNDDGVRRRIIDRPGAWDSIHEPGEQTG